MIDVRYGDLDGTAVLITGGGSGIGAALVKGFMAQGAKVAFIDIAEQASRELCDRLEAGTCVKQAVRLDAAPIARCPQRNRRRRRSSALPAAG